MCTLRTRTKNGCPVAFGSHVRAMSQADEQGMNDKPSKTVPSKPPSTNGRVMMTRKIVLTSLLIGLFVSFAPDAYASGCQATLRIGNGSGRIGDAATYVPLYLTTNQPTRGIQVDVVDKTPGLIATSCSSMIPGWSCPISDSATYLGSSARILIWKFSTDSIPAGTNVEVARLFYVVAPGVAPASIPLTTAGLKIPDAWNSPCAVTGVAGSFVVLP